MDGDNNRIWSFYIKNKIFEIYVLIYMLKTNKDMVACAHQKMALVSTTGYRQWIHTMAKKSATPFGTNDQFCLVQIIWSLLLILVRS